MAYQVSVDEKNKEKAVKVKQINLEGKEVELKPKHKICPLLASNCITYDCEWFADKEGVCSIQLIVVKLLELILIERGK